MVRDSDGCFVQTRAGVTGVPSRQSPNDTAHGPPGCPVTCHAGPAVHPAARLDLCTVSSRSQCVSLLPRVLPALMDQKVSAPREPAF